MIQPFIMIYCGFTCSVKQESETSNWATHSRSSCLLKESLYFMAKTPFPPCFSSYLSNSFCSHQDLIHLSSPAANLRSFFGATVELGAGSAEHGAFQQRTARGGRDVRRMLLQRADEPITLWVRRWQTSIYIPQVEHGT